MQQGMYLRIKMYFYKLGMNVASNNVSVKIIIRREDCNLKRKCKERHYIMSTRRRGMYE